MNLFNILAIDGWVCTGENGIQPALHLIKTVLSIVRIIVPIILIAMTTLDITKKVINPDDKDGQKKIMIRAIAALIVFLIPTIISFTLTIIDDVKGNNGSGYRTESSLQDCWDNA